MSESEAMQAAEAGDLESQPIDNGEAVNEPIEAEQAETPSESSTDSGENREEKVTFSAEQQKVIDDLAAKKTFKIREAEREAEQLRQQLQEVSAKLPQESRPEVPPIPDPYDDDYEGKLQARDQALLKAAEYDVRQRVTQQQQIELQQQQQQQEQQKLVEKASAYTDNAQKKGIAVAQLQTAGHVVASVGNSEDVSNER